MGFYLVCSGPGPDAAGLRETARTAGLDVRDLSSTTWLATAGPGRPDLRDVGPWRLVGDVFHRHRPAVGRTPADHPQAFERKMLARYWGRFVGLRLNRSGEVDGLLRDPSGAMDCLWWTRGPLTLVASDLPDWLVAACGQAWRILPDRVEAALHDPHSTSGALLIEGPQALTPGTLVDLPNPTPIPLWRPDWISRAADPMSDADAAALLRDAVDQAVDGLRTIGRAPAVEISGGLDSSIVAAAIARVRPDDIRLWLNAWGPDASADERPWVARLAAHLGVAATCTPRATGRLDERLLTQMTLGVRPGLAALDGLQDADWARRFRAGGVDAVLTGKGGDSVFIQPADIGVFVELRQEAGWRTLLSPALPALARWNERSVWTLASQARRRGWRPEAIDDPNPLLAPRRSRVPRHPWLEDIADLGPARRRQILGLVQGCTLYGPSLQTQAVSVLHPLLSQPVVEACLSIPIAQLTLGRRDRALARQAFADRLPQPIVERRSKGEMTAFYGRLIADGLDVLRPWLLDGRLAAMGLIDRDAADIALTRESLVWRGGYVDIMVTAAMESWVRAWARRLPGA